MRAWLMWHADQKQSVAHSVTSATAVAMRYVFSTVEMLCYIMHLIRTWYDSCKLQEIVHRRGLRLL